MSIKDVLTVQVPSHVKRQTIEAELVQLKRVYANALAKCLKKQIDDILLTLRKLHVLQDMYIEKRERIKMRYDNDYHTVSYDLDPRCNSFACDPLTFFN